MKERHAIVCASYLILLKEGRVLLMRRSNTGYEDGNYCLPAGHVEKEETVLHALLRETKEEIGLILDPAMVHLGHVMHRKPTSRNEERVDFFFVCEHWSGTPSIMETDKCDAMNWFDLHTLPPNVVPYIQTALEKIRAAILYSDNA
jgi:8-oxo-dGTP pyrophosphatase MutT (NUDIX family)